MLNAHRRRVLTSDKSESKNIPEFDLKMIQNDISKILIKELYKFRYQLSGKSDINELISEYNWDSKQVWKIINHLESHNWIRCWSSAGKYTLTGIGSVNSFAFGLLNKNEVENEFNERKRIVQVLVNKYETSSRLIAYKREEFLPDIDRLEKDIAVFVGDLRDLGYMMPSELRLTEFGYQNYLREKEWDHLLTSFDVVKALNPNKRGKDFELIISSIIKLNGWQVDHSVKNSNEENDLIIYLLRESYLIEVKWLKNPVQATFVRDLVTKLSNRTGMRGIFFSMSGYTKGALEQVNEQLSNELIYLFGPNDILSLMTREKLFDQLLTEKHKIIQSSKKADWS